VIPDFTRENGTCDLIKKSNHFRLHNQRERCSSDFIRHFLSYFPFSLAENSYASHQQTGSRLALGYLVTMDIKGMIQVYSLPNLEVKGDKPDKEWFLYQKNGNSLVPSFAKY
jgi:hypothetical protein